MCIPRYGVVVERTSSAAPVMGTPCGARVGTLFCGINGLFNPSVAGSGVAFGTGVVIAKLVVEGLVLVIAESSVVVAQRKPNQDCLGIVTGKQIGRAHV